MTIYSKNHIEAIITMLNLNSKPEPPTMATIDSLDNLMVPTLNSDPVWKVLIFDEFGRDIISSVLKVADLRENGVTVHMYAYIQNLKFYFA